MLLITLRDGSEYSWEQYEYDNWAWEEPIKGYYCVVVRKGLTIVGVIAASEFVALRVEEDE